MTRLMVIMGIILRWGPFGRLEGRVLLGRVPYSLEYLVSIATESEGYVAATLKA